MKTTERKEVSEELEPVLRRCAAKCTQDILSAQMKDGSPSFNTIIYNSMVCLLNELDDLKILRALD